MDVMRKPRYAIAVWTTSNGLLVAALLLAVAWLGREGWLEVWRFWTASLAPATAAQPNPLQTWHVQLIAALFIGSAAVGLVIDASRRALLALLLVASGVLDVYMRRDSHSGPTVFFLLMMFLMLLVPVVRRHRGRDASEQADAADDHRDGRGNRDARS
jgi:hypothetical protein